MSTIRLQSSDGVVLETEEDVVKCSGTIKTMLDFCGTEELGNAVIPLPNVHSIILRKFLEWANYHKDDAVPFEENDDESDDISPWDANFLLVNQNTLLSLVQASNYLDCKGLMHLTCKAVANMITSKTTEEFCEAFGIENDRPAAAEEKTRENELWG